MMIKHESVRNVDKHLSRITPEELLKVVKAMLISSKYDIHSRRMLLNEIRSKGSSVKPELRIYPDHKISEYQLMKLKHDGWSHYIEAVIEIAASVESKVYSDIVDNTYIFLKESGDHEIGRTLLTRKGMSVVGAILLMAGYKLGNTTYTNREGSRSSRLILKLIPGTELMEHSDRVAMAIARCKRLSIITEEKTDEQTIVNTDDFI